MALQLVLRGHRTEAIEQRTRSVLVDLLDLGDDLSPDDLQRIETECADDCGRPRMPKPRGGFRSAWCAECKERRRLVGQAERNRRYRRNVQALAAAARAAGLVTS